MDNLILYLIAFGALALSVFKDRNKTKKALKKSLKALGNILPQLIPVLLLVAIIIAFFNTELISSLIGDNSGFWGILGASIVGSITLIPGFVAFPAASELLANGAGVAPVAAFVSSLMMVGIVTMPLEISYFGRKTTIIRNSIAFLFSFLAAVFVAWVVNL